MSRPTGARKGSTDNGASSGSRLVTDATVARYMRWRDGQTNRAAVLYLDIIPSK